MALLLKVLPYLGYVPEGFGQIPQKVRTFIAGQLGLLWDCSDDYLWYSSTRDYHLAQVRQFTGWHFATAEALMDSACEQLRRLRVELPTERELQRIVCRTLRGFFQDIHRHITEAIPAEIAQTAGDQRNRP